MNLHDAFLKALADNEDDTTTRLVYADWLDEQGEHEEADRQRQWPAAKEWLGRFCKDSSPNQEFSYEDLIEFGRRIAKEESLSERIHIDLNNEAMWYALQANSAEFWKNWSVVTGIPLLPSNNGFHRWECCPTEVYYYFGSPHEDSSDTNE